MEILLSVLLAICGFLLVRIINKNDEFQKEITVKVDGLISKFSYIDKKIDRNEIEAKAKLNEIINNIPSHKIDLIRESIEELNKKTASQEERQKNSFGKVIILEDRLADQENNIKKMFKILELLANQKKKA